MDEWVEKYFPKWVREQKLRKMSISERAVFLAKESINKIVNKGDRCG
jgi:hypothetical protein